MALLTSPVLLRLHALSILVLAYQLLFHPTALLASPALTLLGQSMRLPQAAFQPLYNPLTSSHTELSSATRELCGLVALVLATVAVAELLAAGGLGVGENLRFGSADGGDAPTGIMGGRTAALRTSRERKGEELAVLSASQGQWMGLAFVRIVTQGALCAWSYLVWGQRDLFGVGVGVGGVGGRLPMRQPELRTILGNQVVFTIALLDMLFWGWLWTVIREERREVLRGVQRWKEETMSDKND